MEDCISFLIWIHYIQGWGNTSLSYTIVAPDISYLQMLYFALLPDVIAYILSINLKGNKLNMKQQVNSKRVFLSILPNLTLFSVGYVQKWRPTAKLLPQFDCTTYLVMSQKASGLHFCSQTFSDR